MDTQILKEIGLTHGEIKTYLALLKRGSSSTGPIAKESGVSRSKLYSILDKLEKKGLASHVEQKGVTYFQAVEPSKIGDYLQKKENDLKNLTTKFEKFLPQLEAVHKESPRVQNVTVYQGLRGLATAHEHTYLKLKRGESYYYLGISAGQPGEQHAYWMRDHMRRAKVGIKCRLLFNKYTEQETLVNRNSYKGCDARLMPTDIKTPAFFLIYKDTVMIAIPSRPPLAIEIVSQEIADSFKSYFDEFWKKTKKFS
jgi:HTH-type transcriptional regulator, sugar sensing transcriptional regulator